MKKTLFSVLAIGLFVTFISCGGAETSKTENGDENQTENVAEEEYQPSEAELNMIKPADIDPNTPIPVGKLCDSYYVWVEKEVIIAGYVKMYLDNDELGENVELLGEIGSYDVLFNCTFKDTLTDVVNKDDIVIIKGKIQENGYWGIKLIDCEFVSVNEEYQQDEELNPYRIPSKPIFAGDLYETFTAWQGIEISIIGYYNGTTTSTLSDGKVYRIDVQEPDNRGNMVGCRMLDEPDNDFLKDNREDVVIRGTIGDDAFGRIMIEECVMVK